MLDIWVDGFNSILLPKITLGKAIFRNPEQRKNWQNIHLSAGMLWGGEPAAHLYDGYLKAEELSIFIDGDLRSAVRELNLIPMGGEGYICILKTFWKEDESPSPKDRQDCVPVLVVYAQLMGSLDSRCHDAARRLINPVS